MWGARNGIKFNDEPAASGEQTSGWRRPGLIDSPLHPCRIGIQLAGGLTRLVCLPKVKVFGYYYFFPRANVLTFSRRLCKSPEVDDSNLFTRPRWSLGGVDGWRVRRGRGKNRVKQIQLVVGIKAAFAQIWRKKSTRRTTTTSFRKTGHRLRLLSRSLVSPPAAVCRLPLRGEWIMRY